MLKVRIKFGKHGSMKFIGHLDVMRYFQKAMRRAEIPIHFTTGYSPHMIMSFAAPLGVGITSDGEYFDIEADDDGPFSTEAVQRLNDVMAEGMTVYSYRKIPDEKKSKAMSLVAAADYEVRLRDNALFGEGWEERLKDFYGQASIPVLKKTKKSERVVDIKPLIYKLKVENGVISMRTAAGSADNLKPELLLEAFAKAQGIALPTHALLVHRLEMYANADEDGERRFVSLEALGSDIGGEACES